METKIELAYLYDFYGEMLNEHQQRIFEDFVLNDLSLGEIAAEEGTSRQAVNDMVQRCSKKLMDYENKLHLVEKFTDVKKKMKEIDELAKASESLTDTELREQILKIQNLAGDLIQSF